MTADTDTFYLKRGDRLPKMRRPLLGPDGLALDLTTASGVVMHMRNRDGGAVKITAGACAIIAPPTGGVVEYAWAATDTDTAGTFEAEFEVTFSGLKMTVPNASNVSVRIGEDIA